MLIGREMWAYNRCRGRQLDYRRMVERLGDRRTSRHCFIFYSVRASGGCGNSLPNVHPEAKSEDV